MATQITLAFQNLPADYCFTTPQQLALDISSRLTGTLAGSASLYTVGKDLPSTDNEDRPWLKLNSDGSPNRLYYYWQGQWTSEHPIPPSSAVRQLWTSTTGALSTYDGGDANPISVTSGPMWEVDTDFAALFPIGVGTTANNTVIGVGDTGGEDEHVLTIEELAAHIHSEAIGTGNEGRRVIGSGNDLTDEGDTGTTGEDQPHNNLPPYRGVYFIKRTQRQFYVAS